MYSHWQFKTSQIMALILCSAGLAACSPSLDMQGHDPVEYYADHPIKNTVETKNFSQKLHFAADSSRLDESQVDQLRHALHDISPMAADGVTVEMSSYDITNKARQKHLVGMLRSMGYNKEQINFKPSAELTRNDVSIDMQYAVVVSPACPDWRRSPVTTYSNTTQGNIGCATAVNLGAMVANPNDLLHGTGDISPDTARTVHVVDQYRSVASGTGSSGSASSGSSASSSGSGAGAASSALPDGGGH